MIGFRIHSADTKALIISISCDCGRQAMTEISACGKSSQSRIGQVVDLTTAYMLTLSCNECGAEYLLESRMGNVTCEHIKRPIEQKEVK